MASLLFQRFVRFLLPLLVSGGIVVMAHGGSWLDGSGSLRCRARGSDYPGFYDFNDGFRVVCPSPVF